MGRVRSGENSETVQSVVRALTLLEVLATEGTPLAITDLAKKVGLKLTTVYRLLSTLMVKGFVEQDRETQKYRLGIKAFELGNSALYNLDLRSVARPFLEELVDKVNETTNLAILDGSEVVYIDQVESTNIVIVKMFARVGSRGPAHCTGSGKVLLSGLSDSELARVVEGMELVSFTENTITDKEKLLKEIKKVRELGYAIDDVERDEGVRCVAAPVYNHENRIVAAISVSGPITRINEETIEHFIPLVKETALSISRRLGYVKIA